MLIEGIAGLADRKAPVTIIGSGPVGLALAVDLARRKIPVLLLESGETNANDTIQQLSHARLTDARRHDDMSVAVARRLGGASNLWGARCIPFDHVDFRPRDFIDARWPIDAEVLAPYWQRALDSTKAGANVFAADTPLCPGADPSFSPDTLERWANVQAAQNVHAEAIRSDPHLEVRTQATVVGFNLGEDGRATSIEVAHSLTGERVTLPVERLVIAAGGLETTRLLLATQQRHPALFGGKDGPLGRYYMGHLIGEIADIVFASTDLGRAFDFMVDKHGTYVRRRLIPTEATQIEHELLNCAFWPVVAPVADPAHRSAILSMVYLALAVGPFGRLLVAEAIRRRHIPDEPKQILRHIANVVTGMPQAIIFATKFLYRRYFRPERLPGFFVLNAANRYGLFFHSEQAPKPTSRVWLNGDVDRLGLPELEIDLQFSEQDIDSVIRTHDLMDDWLRKAGIGRIEYRMALEDRRAAILAQASHGTHQIGIARMGTDRTTAVVDADLRSFDVPNLYLATTAVLPTSGQANPTLTAVALALRLGDRFAEELFAPPAPVHSSQAAVL